MLLKDGTQAVATIHRIVFNLPRFLSNFSDTSILKLNKNMRIKWTIPRIQISDNAHSSIRITFPISGIRAQYHLGSNL